MTNEAFNFVSGFFSRVWLIFNSWYFPGTNITPAALLLLPALVYVAIKAFRYLGGLDSSGDDK